MTGRTLMMTFVVHTLRGRERDPGEPTAKIGKRYLVMAGTIRFDQESYGVYLTEPVSTHKFLRTRRVLGWVAFEENKWLEVGMNNRQRRPRLK